MAIVVQGATLLVFALIWAALVAALRWKARQSVPYLIYFTVFYVYLFKVLDYTVLQYQSLIVLKLFMPSLILNGQADGEWLNLVPLVTLTAADLPTSLLNVLMLIPFGFGLPFVTALRARGVVLAGALFSAGIELLQLATGLMAGITFRVADVNDIIFNTAGAAIGYAAFAMFARLYVRLSGNWAFGNHAILRHITERPQLGRQLS